MLCCLNFIESNPKIMGMILHNVPSKTACYNMSIDQICAIALMTMTNQWTHDAVLFPDSADGPRQAPRCRRFLRRSKLGSPRGLSGGNGSRGFGGSIFSRIAL